MLLKTKLYPGHKGKNLSFKVLENNVSDTEKNFDKQ